MAQGDDVLLQTPYIICNDKMYNDLEALAETRQLRVLTNAVENGANPSGCSDYLREKQNILSRGVDVYEVVCGQSLHTKTILIGDDLSIVGSFNADMRSAYLDTELMLVIESEEVNAALRQESVQYIDQSRLALHDGGTEYGARFEEMTLPWAKRALYRGIECYPAPDPPPAVTKKCGNAENEGKECGLCPYFRFFTLQKQTAFAMIKTRMDTFRVFTETEDKKGRSL